MREKTNQDTCYMCNAVAISREHVPPKCLFPQFKDISSLNYRKNLITVPSCLEHNCSKSNDDEFLMVSLAGILGNNSIGYEHKFGKVNRAIKRSSDRLLNEVFIKKKRYLFKYQDNKYFEVIWGTPDYERLLKCFKHIAYGVHYQHFKQRFEGQTKILPVYLHNEERSSRNFIALIKHQAEADLRQEPKYGENEDVFYYQFTKPDEFGLYLLRLCFYEGIDVYISFEPSSSKIPSHFVFELIKGGIETHIELNNKTYSFNELNNKNGS